jgi:hypothetical protein
MTAHSAAEACIYKLVGMCYSFEMRKENHMKRILTAGTFAMTLACGIMLAQDTAPSSAAPGTPPAQQPSQTQPSSATSQTNGGAAPRIAPGSIIPVELTKTVDAKKAKTGDEVEAKVTMDMKSTTGEVLVPKDTKVTGHVTEAQARNKEQKESQLAISFDQATLKNQQVQLPMSIQAVIGPQNSNDKSANVPSGPSGSSPSSSASGATSPMGGRSSPMGGNAQQPNAPAGSAQSSNAPQETNQRPPITANTQGVIGISNVSLGPAPNGTQGSLLSSEKNNVKLESGTMLLLKVSQ